MRYSAIQASKIIQFSPTLIVKAIVITAIIVATYGYVVLPSARAAEPFEPKGITPVDVSTETKFINIISNTASALFNILMALAVILLIVSALFYLTAAGNETQLTRAKNTLIYAIVAVVIALIAVALPNLVREIAT